jgi:hypothetical protein
MTNAASGPATRRDSDRFTSATNGRICEKRPDQGWPHDLLRRAGRALPCLQYEIASALAAGLGIEDNGQR